MTYTYHVVLDTCKPHSRCCNGLRDSRYCTYSACTNRIHPPLSSYYLILRTGRRRFGAVSANFCSNDWLGQKHCHVRTLKKSRRFGPISRVNHGFFSLWMLSSRTMSGLHTTMASKTRYKIILHRRHARCTTARVKT